MLIQIRYLLSHQGDVTKETVESIVRGIEAGDKIPPIKVVK